VPVHAGRKLATLKLLLLALLAICGSGPFIVDALLVSVAPNGGGGAALDRKYLADLKPITGAVRTAESKLELPATASGAQVNAIVSPLRKVLAPLVALSTSAAASPTMSLERLELGPSFRQAVNDGTPDCGLKGKMDMLFNVLIGGSLYNHGSQLVTDGDLDCAANWFYYRWALWTNASPGSGLRSSVARPRVPGAPGSSRRSRELLQCPDASSGSGSRPRERTRGAGQSPKATRPSTDVDGTGGGELAAPRGILCR